VRLVRCRATGRRPFLCGAEQEAGAAFCSACGAALAGGARRATPAAAHEERRVVTILFADLAGSTAVGDRLDPEEVRAVQAGLFGLVNDEVERTGGVTEKFVGDAVMAVFGIPLAHEDDAERAVRAALAARDAFPAFAARVRGRHGLDVGLRIGVNTGEVIAGREAAARGELMVSGDAVNVAARLQQHAEPGQVLVGARTHAATQGLVAYRKLAAVEAKGKRERVPTWEALATTSLPGRRSQAGVTAPLIGRSAELSILEAVAARVGRERVPQLVTIYGHAGIGKSRLLHEFLQRLPAARLLQGRCVPYGDGITYLPLAEATKGFAGILETDARDLAAAKLDSAIASVLPEDGAAVGEALGWMIGLALPKERTESSDARTWLLGAWRRFLGALGRDRLTVLAIEDIHWASESLLDILASLAETLDDAAVVIACPARPELLDRRPAWGGGSQNATTLSLGPLSPAESSELVAALLEASDLPDEARQRVLERTEGNPFFVEEIVGMWIDSGALVRQNGGWVAGAGLAQGPLPDSIHAVIAARLDLLDASSRDALRRCAVVGRDLLALGCRRQRGGRRRALAARPRLGAAGLDDVRAPRVRVQARPDARRCVRGAAAP
jgi:class 3 adenylate cyclase